VSAWFLGQSPRSDAKFSGKFLLSEVHDASSDYLNGFWFTAVTVKVHQSKTGLFRKAQKGRTPHPAVEPRTKLKENK
jgi:hypothetical protein